MRIVVLTLPLLCVCAAPLPPPPSLAPHPRLILTHERVASVQASIASGGDAATFAAQLFEHADFVLTQPVEPRGIADGSGVLIHARIALDYMLTCAAAHRFNSSGGESGAYLERAVREGMNAATNWVDWNTKQHALDTGELLLAVALLYDWVYEDLTVAQRSALVVDGITTRGLMPYKDFIGTPTFWWVNNSINWNCVCSSGGILATLATLGDVGAPAWAWDDIFNPLVIGVQPCVGAYNIDSSWEEGPGYWSYASKYNVWMFAALDSVLGSSLGLTDILGVRNAARFPLYSTGAGALAGLGKTYDWADSETGALWTPFAQWWGGAPFHDSAAAYWSRVGSRLLAPAFMNLPGAWGGFAESLVFYDADGSEADITSLPTSKVYPYINVAIFRSAWDAPEAGQHYLSFKGGNTSWNHGHLDLGSFVFDFAGQRFAEDLGADSYELPGYFGPQRFSYYRLNTHGHNTLLFGNTSQNHPVSAVLASFNITATASYDGWAIVDLSAAYAVPGIISSVRRGFVSLPSASAVLIVDEITYATADGSTNPPANVTFQIHTRATVTRTPPGALTLTSAGVSATLSLLPNATDCPSLEEEWDVAPITQFLPDPPFDSAVGITRVQLLAQTPSMWNPQCSRIAVALGDPKVVASLMARGAGSIRPLDMWAAQGPFAPPAHDNVLGVGRLDATAPSSYATPQSAVPEAAPAVVFFVDCVKGNDASDGSSAHPFLSLTRARDALRALQPLAAAASVTVLPGDCYPRNSSGVIDFSQSVLSLEPQDSGTAAAPITYAAAAGSPAPRFLAGVKVPPSAWRATAMPGVFVADLGPKGLDLARYGFGEPSAFGCAGTALELFFQGVPGIVARYPNLAPDGTPQWLNVGGVINKDTAFTTKDTRVLAWANESQAWLHGYWGFDWADSYVQVASIVEVAGGARVTVNTSTPPAYGFKANARFYGMNLRSELDAVLEYYVDTAASALYFMPPGGNPGAGECFLSVGSYVVDASAGALSWVTLSGFEVLFARGTGLNFPSADHVTLSNITASNHGVSAAIVQGTHNRIEALVSSGVGCAAVAVGGGNTTTLAPGNNTVTGSTLTRYARTKRTYEAGIAWSGVANTYAFNEVSWAPHTGMLGGGVSNTFLNNTFYKLCSEVSDSGAWYSGRSWTNRGNRLVGNTFIHIRTTERIFLGYPSVQAVYLDDELSGTILEDNLCIDSQKCFFVGGGRDTIIRNNRCEDADLCVHIDNRGMGSGAASCRVSPPGLLVQQLYAVNYTYPPYAVAFPEIVDTLQRRPCVPVNVSVTGNTFCHTAAFLDTNEWASWDDVVSNNTEDTLCPRAAAGDQ